MPVQKTVHLCLSCGFPFEALLSEVARGRGKYCSNRCVGDANRRGLNLVDCVCRHCGITFQVHHARVVLGEGLYCSRRCFALSIEVPIEQRFWTHVHRCTHEALCVYCCWPWQGKRTRPGYGKTTAEGKECLAHRQAWALHHGVNLPPSSLVIRHLCHVPPCCNPAHLMSGTVADNARDRVLAGRAPKGEQHPYAKLRNADIPYIYALLVQGIDVQSIAKQYEVSTALIYLIAHGKKWQHLLPPDAKPIRGLRVGIKHPKAKFTEAEIKTIRALYTTGINCAELGRQFHASDETIRMIVLRKTWRHVL